MKKAILATIIAMASILPAQASEYKIDTTGSHASINWKIQHLGYSWLTGRFNDFSGNFSYDDKNIEETKINVKINVSSIDSNHAERDKHLRSSDFLNVSDYKTASFSSTSVTKIDDNNFKVNGMFELLGVKKEITINATKIGEGKDPWGGYRVGFEGTTILKLKDFNINTDLGDKSSSVLISLNIEGVRI